MQLKNKAPLHPPKARIQEGGETEKTYFAHPWQALTRTFKPWQAAHGLLDTRDRPRGTVASGVSQKHWRHRAAKMLVYASGRILIPSDAPRNTDKEKMFLEGGSMRYIPSGVNMEGKGPRVTTGGKDPTASVTQGGTDNTALLPTAKCQKKPSWNRHLSQASWGQNHAADTRRPPRPPLSSPTALSVSSAPANPRPLLSSPTSRPGVPVRRRPPRSFPSPGGARRQRRGYGCAGPARPREGGGGRQRPQRLAKFKRAAGSLLVPGTWWWPARRAPGCAAWRGRVGEAASLRIGAGPGGEAASGRHGVPPPFPRAGSGPPRRMFAGGRLRCNTVAGEGRGGKTAGPGGKKEPFGP